MKRLKMKRLYRIKELINKTNNTEVIDKILGASFDINSFLLKKSKQLSS